MKKVILKCKISSRDSFEQKLSDIDLDFSPIYWQHDRVYVPRGYKKGMNYPRLILRTEMKSVDRPAKYTLLMRRHIEDSGIDLSEETVIKDYTKMANIILQLGFKPAGEVSRRREELKMSDNTFIYLDKIENQPGYYAKIETDLLEGDSATETRAELEKTFASLGETNLVDSAYFEL